MPQSIAYPPPFRGQNNNLPVAAISSPFCERMENFIPDGSVLRVRNGNKKWTPFELGTTITSLNISPYGQRVTDTGTIHLAMVGASTGNRLRWYNITLSGAPILVHSCATGVDDEIHTLYFNNSLYYFGNSSLAVGGANGPQVFNGSVWGATSYSWPVGFNPFGGMIHKNRAYFLNSNGPTYGYTGIDSLGGAVTEVNLSSVLSYRGLIYIMRSLSLTQNLTPENIAVFIISTGEVLAYAGAWPDGSDWSIIARFRISQPIYQNSFCDAKGDTFLFTDKEILSLRNLFVSGYDVERNEGIGATIKDRYRQIIQGIKNLNPARLKLVKGVYDEVKDRLIISFPYYVDPSTGGATNVKNLFLVYDFTLQAWYEEFQNFTEVNYVTSADYFDGYSYFFTQNTTGDAYVMQVQGMAAFADEQADTSGSTSIDYRIKSAPLDVPKFGTNLVTGVEVISQSDMTTTANVRLISDLGRQVTDPQSVPLGDTTVSKPLYNVGIEGNYIQYELYGTSLTNSTAGYKLYASNIWFESGQKGSR